MSANDPSNAENSPERAAAKAYFRQPRQLSDPPKTFDQWLISFLVTGIFGIIVLAIWDWGVWKKFALVFWLIVGAWIVFALCLSG